MTTTIPAGYHTVTPFLSIGKATEFLGFVEKVLGATVMSRLDKPDGGLLHAEIKIGDSIVMLMDTMPNEPAGKSTLYVYVDDVDGIYQRAMEAGAPSLQKPMKTFYGDYSGGFVDPAGNHWWLAKRVEEVSEDELKRRIESFQSAS